MEIEYDPNKNNRNIEQRGISFEQVHDFDWDTATIKEQIREAQTEQRFVAVGKINHRLHVLVFTLRNHLRVIRLRKANDREIKDYEDNRSDHR